MSMKNQSGFTLVELSIVLVIVGLILNATLSLVFGQLDQKQNAKAKTDLIEIREALLGYALVFSKLPCPDVNGDGLADSCSNLTTQSTEGNLPWATLGLPPKDPWGRYYQYRINNAFTSIFQLTSSGSGAGIIKICADAGCTKTQSSNVPLVVYTKGANGAEQPLPASDEAENVDLDGVFVFHEPVQKGYDDLLMWISSNVLMNRMVSVGKLP